MIEIDRIRLMRFIDDAVPWSTELRRELHQIPELGNQEVMTCEKVKSALDELDIPYIRMLETGITANLYGEKSIKDGVKVKTIALRAELDGLPITEESDLTFSSKSEGKMHACGHDVHMAILLGTAKVLKNMGKELHGNTRLIFQPAEETTGGAQRMIECGCLEKVNVILGLHVRPNMPVGTIGIKNGRLHPSSLMFRLVVKGRGCHGAYPHQGVDAIVIAAQIVTNSQSILARNVNPLEAGLITFGKVKGGNARNVIADEVSLDGIIRAFGKNELDFLKERLIKVSESTAEGQGGFVKFEFMEGYPVLENHKLVTKNLKDVISQEKNLKLEELELPTMGVDDFACFTERVPGAMCFLGAGFHGMGKREHSLHSNRLVLNEDCIKTGILYQTLAVLRLM